MFQIAGRPLGIVADNLRASTFAPKLMVQTPIDHADNILGTDGSYLVIEIECPGKTLITRAGHPSADVTHAEHQVTDYRNYMMRHIGNVKDVIPGFSDPDCLVVIGLESNLTPEQREVLASLNGARHRVKVVDFDWLLERAERVSKNVSENGVVVSVQRMT